MNYHRDESRSLFPSLPSISPTDPGHMYPIPREMGPPSLDFPPRPMEIDLNVRTVNASRILPNPSGPVASAWDQSIFQSQGSGELSYSSSNASKIGSMDNNTRGSPQGPLLNWLDDGPWVPLPNAVPNISSGDRMQTKYTGNRKQISYGYQYRQPNPSDVGSYQYGAPHSDSGYGTLRSVGNTSVFSGDIPERDDCQSLASHVAEYQPFQGLNDGQQRDPRIIENWNQPGPKPLDSHSLHCPTCGNPVKTQSELKKHDLRHRKPFICNVQGCSRKEGFSTTNDLDRHIKSIHPLAIPESASVKKYRCHIPGCKSKDKSWPRLDNFRSHLKRVHSSSLRSDEDFDNMIRRAEFWETASLVDPNLPLQEPSLPDVSHEEGSVDYDSPSRQREPQSDWKSVQLEVNPQPQELVTPQDYRSLENKAAHVPNGRSPLPEVPQRDTVQPGDIFQPPNRVPDTRISLDSVLLAPVGRRDTSMPQLDHSVSAPAPVKATCEGKAPRQTLESAADATLEEEIKSVLAGPHSPGGTTDRNTNHDLDQQNPPVGKASPPESWPTDPNSATGSSKGADSPASSGSSPSSIDDSKDFQVQKTLEVIRLLRERGYTIQKDPNHCPKVQNAGSVAGNKSENQVTCLICKKFKGRPCELKKHMKRHERPYGCTFLNCNKSFGSKNDWKRHENSQHFHLETWRCDEERPEGGACAKVCYRQQTFRDHLKKDHQVSEEDDVKSKLDACRIGRNCQARFWCGFCSKLVDLKKKGLEAWTERFDHIDDHFMGRHGGEKRSIQDWIPVDSYKPIGESESLKSLGSGASPAKDSQVSSSDDSAPPSPPSAGASAPAESSKRARASSDEEEPSTVKRPRIAAPREVLIYCCQCKIPHNPKLNERCTSCDDSHRFCSSCVVENRKVGT